MAQGSGDAAIRTEAVLPTEAEVATMRFRFKVSEPKFDSGSGLRQKLGRSRLALVFGRSVSEEWITHFLQQKGVSGGIERHKKHTYLVAIPLHVRKSQWMQEIGSHPNVRYVGRFW